MKWGMLSDFDVRFSGQFRLKPEQRGWYQLASFIAHSGDSWFWLLGLTLVWLLAPPAGRNLAAFMAISLVAEAVFVIAIKFTVRRRRPDGEWGAIYRATDPHSFPSGHAARAGLLAVVALSLAPAWFGLLLAIWAPLVSAARVIMGVHYLSDVVVGLFIGVISGLVMVQFYPLVVSIVPFVFG
jgi:undecaprenyl-diphosphatase